MIDDNMITAAIAKVKQSAKERKFDQTYDLVVTFKDLDLKKTEQHVDFYVLLPHHKGKANKVCGLVGSELKDEATKELDLAIQESDFAQVASSKSQLRKIASEYDYFIAQANIMPKVAQYFGRVLGPRGKMPNPKAGCVVPPKVQLAPLKKKLENTVRVSVKKAPHLQLAVGMQSMSDAQIKDNVKEVYSQLLSQLPLGANNIKRVYLKLTMSPIERVL